MRAVGGTAEAAAVASGDVERAVRAGAIVGAGEAVGAEEAVGTEHGLPLAEALGWANPATS